MPSEAEMRLRERLTKLKNLPLIGGVGVSGELAKLERQIERIADEPSTDEVWHSVELARHEARPYTLDYVERICDDFIELHGDRSEADDAAIVAGLGRFRGRSIALVGHQKGRDLRERAFRNFGMPYPAGYRKAMRIMELAERSGLPVVTFVDVPGAHPGPESEERGIAEAIARSVGLMTRLRTPIVTVITGEGGSGGALAIAVGDVVLALENAVYSVISPEGCASILWRTTDEAATGAAVAGPSRNRPAASPPTRAPNTGSASKRGRHSQSSAPSLDTSAAVRVSPTSP